MFDTIFNELIFNILNFFKTEYKDIKFEENMDNINSFISWKTNMPITPKKYSDQIFDSHNLKRISNSDQRYIPMTFIFIKSQIFGIQYDSSENFEIEKNFQKFSKLKREGLFINELLFLKIMPIIYSINFSCDYMIKSLIMSGHEDLFIYNPKLIKNWTYISPRINYMIDLINFLYGEEFIFKGENLNENFNEDYIVTYELLTAYANLFPYFYYFLRYKKMNINYYTCSFTVNYDRLINHYGKSYNKDQCLLNFNDFFNDEELFLTFRTKYSNKIKNILINKLKKVIYLPKNILLTKEYLSDLINNDAFFLPRKLATETISQNPAFFGINSTWMYDELELIINKLFKKQLGFKSGHIPDKHWLKIVLLSITKKCLINTKIKYKQNLTDDIKWKSKITHRFHRLSEYHFQKVCGHSYFTADHEDININYDINVTNDTDTDESSTGSSIESKENNSSSNNSENKNDSSLNSDNDNTKSNKSSKKSSEHENQKLFENNTSPQLSFSSDSKNNKKKNNNLQIHLTKDLKATIKLNKIQNKIKYNRSKKIKKKKTILNKYRLRKIRKIKDTLNKNKTTTNFKISKSYEFHKEKIEDKSNSNNFTDLNMSFLNESSSNNFNFFITPNNSLGTLNEKSNSKRNFYENKNLFL